MKKHILYLAGILTTVLFSSLAYSAPDTNPALPDWAAVFNGQLRVYDFQRFNNNNLGDPSVRSALAVAGKLFLQTKRLSGFSIGAGLYASSDLGLSPLLSRRDTSLMGSSDTFATPAEAFLQYNWRSLQIRAGNQLLKTPWVWGSDSRVIPAAFQGLSLDLMPMNNLDIMAGYMQRWKSRTASDFSTTNLYGVDPSGFWYTGANYKIKSGQNDFKLSGWYYGFTDIANLFYADLSYRYHTGGSWDPLAAVQFAHESDTGNALLGKVDSSVFGALAGIAVGKGTYTIAYDAIPSSAGAYHNGNIVTPYTYKYATDPLFTTSMTQGLADQNTSGHAWKAKAVYWLGAQRRWRLIGSYARYSQSQFLHPNQTGNPSEIDADITYFVHDGALKGLSIRDRIGYFTYPGADKAFIYNRIQLQYNF